MLMDYVRVFIVGGIICLIAQVMMDYFKMQTPYVMVTYVTTGVVLTFLGLYEPLVKFAADRCNSSYNRIWIFTCYRSNKINSK